LGGIFHQDAEQGRVQVQVEVAVDVVQGQAGGAELPELRAHLRPQLFAQVPLEKPPPPRAGGVGAELPPGIDQPGNSLPRQRRMAE